MARVLRLSRRELHKRAEISGLQVMSPALTLMETEVANAYPSYESIDDFLKQFIQVLMTDRRPDTFHVTAEIAQQTIDRLRELRVSRTMTTDDEFVVKNVITCEDIICHKPKNYLQHFRQLLKNLEKQISVSKNFKLTKIDSLITSDEETVDCIVFGFLMKDHSKINEYVIEDDSGRVPLLLSDETEFKDSLITENVFVIIQGSYDCRRDLLHVEDLGLMPPTDWKMSIERSNALQRVGRMVVIVSDIHLDDSNTLDKLKTLLTGYESTVPIPDAFIFVGDFLRNPYEEVSHFKAHMKNFVKLVSKFDKISQLSQIIFVPGFNDNDGQQIPKHPLSVDMFPHSTTRIKNFHLASNPVNIYIDGRHICLFAFPYASKLRKHVISDQTESYTEFGSGLATLILSNAHLSAGISKSLDSCLSLFHLPDFLLISDKEVKDNIDGKAYDFTDFLNLPSFSRHNFKFKVIYTNPKLVENSQILV